MKAMFVNEAIKFQRAQGGDKESVFGKLGVGQGNIKITWGKYKGRSVGEVYADDPQYIAWLAQNGQPRRGQEKLFAEINRLNDLYWKGIAEKRATEGGTFYGEEGVSVFRGPVEVRNLKYFVGDYGASYRFQTKTPDHWFQFYINLDRLGKMLDLKPEPGYTYVDDQVLKEAIFDLKGKTIEIKGKVKFHKEVLGHNYTNLNYVSILPTIKL